MGQDIRKMMKDFKPAKPILSDGHEARFEAKLNASSPGSNRTMYMWMRIAAIIVTVLAVGYFTFYATDDGKSDSLTANDTENNEKVDEAQITLGDLSPDLKKIEDYYMAGINVQLASLLVTDDNKELVDSYLRRLSELDKEYQILNKELNEVGPTEATITALVDNLQLRLELLFKLKNKLKELKKQNNENINII